MGRVVSPKATHLIKLFFKRQCRPYDKGIMRVELVSVLANSTFILLTKKKMKTIEDVIEFIIKNSDNTERMDRINKITFPFTSKYNNKFTTKKKETIWI
jgi:hypothetical protein